MAYVKPGRGGVRPGSGRPKGSKQLLSKHDIRAAVVSEGISPLEVMLKLMRKSWDNLCILEKDEFVEVKHLANARKETFDYASAAAPYCHPRLAQIKNESDDANGKVTLQISQDDASL